MPVAWGQAFDVLKDLLKPGRNEEQIGLSRQHVDIVDIRSL